MGKKLPRKQLAKQPFKFKNNASIGALQAELDNEFLQQCFIDTGDLETAIDIDDPKSIIVGRTGSGKSALMLRIKECEEHVIEVSPENLSIDYIANSNIISFFDEAGVNLDVLFRLLWRHVLVVELLKAKYELKNESATIAFVRNIAETINPDKSKLKGINYLKQWGEHFWEETEYRVKEVVSNIENKLSSKVNGLHPGLTLSAEAAKKLTEGERQEVIQRGKKAVADVQIKDLGEVIKVLAEDVFTNKQQRFYLIIDRLDENWASQRVRYKLIRALIEEIRSFRKIESIKILASLRLDLLEDVFEKTKDSGFQEEKYRDLLLPIRWNESTLYELVKARLEYLLKYKYTTESVQFSSIFPGKVGKRKTFDYILERTFLRPRDAISYVNLILERAAGRSTIPVDLIKSVEEDYSDERLRSVQHEWASIYPCIGHYMSLLEKRNDGFRIHEITDEQLNEVALSLMENDPDCKDPASLISIRFLNQTITLNTFRYELVNVFYHIGIVGVKLGPRSSIKWSFEHLSMIGKLNLKPDVRVYIHPMFRRTLNIVLEENVH